MISIEKSFSELFEKDLKFDPRVEWLIGANDLMWNRLNFLYCGHKCRNYVVFNAI